MKKILLYTLMTWTSLQLPAQITVTSSTFRAVGDVLHYVQASNPGVAIALFTPPGGDQFWDLITLTASFNFDIEFLPAAQGTNAGSFPTATMVVFKESDEYYYSSSATKLESPGLASDSVSGLPLIALYKNAPFFTERHAPDLIILPRREYTHWLKIICENTFSIILRHLRSYIKPER